MKELPILFSTEMVQANLDGRKTMTRRLNGLDEINENPEIYLYKGVHPENPLIHIFARIWKGHHVESIHIKSSYGQPCDLLWVREKWRFEEAYSYDGDDYPAAYWYYASTPQKVDCIEEIIDKADWKWKPSIHMPKAVSRIWLQVEEIRVERLESISSDDAKAEGIKFSMSPIGFCGWDYQTGGYNVMTTPVTSFMSLWRSVHGIDRYAKTGNPWVWVVKYKVQSTTGKPKTEPG
ncbi:MAG: hypothetical protein A2066_21745 [Bacteroidetes bacterium GWB2_41_8]|nr:MAG: hypothetical protein A2066_21745 [Bacteroidetes bacterium GWB2_41_8]